MTRSRQPCSWLHAGALLCALASVSACKRLSRWGSETRPTPAPVVEDSSPVTEAAAAPASAKRKRKSAHKRSRRRGRRAALGGNTGTWWRAYAFFVPDVFDGYRARIATEGHDVALGAGMGFVSVKRAYAKDGLLVEVELLDAARCQRLREVFLRSRDVHNDGSDVVIRPIKVQGQPALSQWLKRRSVARTSILVADRFVISVNAKPAKSPAASVAVAQALDFAGLQQLATVPAFPEEDPEDFDSLEGDAPVLPSVEREEREARASELDDNDVADAAAAPP